jgi:uncharacterized protein YjiS (DUF1127 family)
MIMSTTTIAGTDEQTGSGALARVAAALKRLGTAYVSWRLDQAALATLNSMSERELADVGLSRSDIPRAMRSGGAARLR